MSIGRKELKTIDFKGVTSRRKLAPVHPGAVLLADFIEPMGLTRYRVSKVIGVQQRRIDEICAGTRAITADTALRLGLLFKMEPEFWLRCRISSTSRCCCASTAPTSSTTSPTIRGTRSQPDAAAAETLFGPAACIAADPSAG